MNYKHKKLFHTSPHPPPTLQRYYVLFKGGSFIPKKRGKLFGPTISITIRHSSLLFVVYPNSIIIICSQFPSERRLICRYVSEAIRIDSIRFDSSVHQWSHIFHLSIWFNILNLRITRIAAGPDCCYCSYWSYCLVLFLLLLLSLLQ